MLFGSVDAGSFYKYVIRICTTEEPAIWPTEANTGSLKTNPVSGYLFTLVWDQQTVHDIYIELQLSQ